MSDQPEAKTLNLEEMRSYLLIGIDKDGEFVTAAPPDLSLPEMGMLLGRAQTDLNIQCAGLGAFQAMQRMKAQQIIQHPGRGPGGPGGITQ